MEKLRFKQAILFPILAALVVVVYAGGLGAVFTVLNEEVVKEWAVVVLGTIITVTVPTAAYLLERKYGQS